MQSVNPATGELIREYREFTTADTERAIASAHTAFLRWRDTDSSARAKLMQRTAAVLRKDVEKLARLMTEEMGKPIRQARAEIEKCAWVCEYYAEHAAVMLADEPVKTEATRSFITYRPLGVVLAVMPWNFPFWQVFRFAAPALMAGNGAVLKHASNVCGCSLAIEEVFRAAGFPEHLFTSLLIGSDKVNAVIEHKHIAAVTLTGSVNAGKAVAAKAGACLKKTVLELGGSDPYLILADADIARAAQTCATSRLLNNGQSCIAAKRFIVVEAVYNAFLKAFVAAMEKQRMGNPTEVETSLGPQATALLRNELHHQVEKSVTAGAKIRLGGKVPEEKGAWYPATVLTEVKPGMPAYDEELFGPVASVIRAKDEAEAIRIANDSRFGLGAAVFTKDNAHGETVARQLETGCAAVNDFVKSDPRLPFGGCKESGYGRELSAFGIREFVNIRSVVIA